MKKSEEKRGHVKIVEVLKKRNIRPEFVLDEGGTIARGIIKGVTPPVALIGISEKGFLTLRLTARGEGGHSSMPPKNTMVGILSRAIYRLENNQLPARIDGPTRQLFFNIGPHMSFLKKLPLANLWLFESIIISMLEKSHFMNAVIRTTTAATMFKGSVQDNVLPQKATAAVNFRILPGDCIKSVIEYVKKTINDDRITVEQFPDSAEPSPVSDTSNPSYLLLEKSIKSVFQDTIVSPYLVVGATDSRHYAKISENSYRFTPLQMVSEDLKRLHGTNERISVKNFAEMIQFYVHLMGKI